MLKKMLFSLLLLASCPCGVFYGQDPAEKSFVNCVGMKLCRVSAGTFFMGSPVDEEGSQDDEQLHEVEISKTFFLGAFEVTQGQYKLVMGKNPSTTPGDGLAARHPKTNRIIQVVDTSSYPVHGVEWEDAVEFCRRLSEFPSEKAAGRVYRLPTEAEWEYACRAGTRSPWSFGESFDMGGRDHVVGGPPYEPVGSRKANAWQLHDMHGNVGEWCVDAYTEYPTAKVVDPIGKPGKSRTERSHVLRGVGDSRSAKRSFLGPDLLGRVSCDHVGFRVVCSIRDAYTNGDSVDCSIATLRLQEGRKAGDLLYVIIDGQSFRFRWCPSGRFAFRLNGDGVVSDLTIPAGFWMQETEMTQRQVCAIAREYVRVERETRFNRQGKPEFSYISEHAADWFKLEMEHRTWIDLEHVLDEPAPFLNYLGMEVVKVMNWKMSKSGHDMKRWKAAIPTESLWEYAIRATSDSSYCFGDDVSELSKYARFGEKKGDDGRWRAGDAGTRRPNLWGIHDGHGSLWEIVARVKKDAPDQDARESDEDDDKNKYVLRGGSGLSNASDCSSFSRRSYFGSESPHPSEIGLRVVIIPFSGE